MDRRIFFDIRCERQPEKENHGPTRLPEDNKHVIAGANARSSNSGQAAPRRLRVATAHDPSYSIEIGGTARLRARAHGREFDDSGFDRVVVPHTNVRLPWHGFDDKTYELFRSTATLQIAARSAGRHGIRRLEGVMTLPQCGSTA